MKKSEYIFTGFDPSGNPFLWYYDENKKTIFDDSISVAQWDKLPKIGDKISYEKSGNYNEITEKVYINGELVYTRSEENEKRRDELNEKIHNELKRQKGFLK